MSTGEFDGVEPRLRIAERLGGRGPGRPAGAAPGGLVVADQDELARLPGWVRIYRAGLALMAGDVAGTIDARPAGARRAPRRTTTSVTRAATALIGLASWCQGDLEAADAAYAETHAAASSAAGLRRRRPRLRDHAGRHPDRPRAGSATPSAPTRRRSTSPPQPRRARLRGTADMHVGLGMVHRERGDLRPPEQLRLAATSSATTSGCREPVPLAHREARIREAEGDLTAALDLLDEAERVYDGDFSPDVRPVAAMRARVWVAQGRPDRALGWARERGLSADDEPELPARVRARHAGPAPCSADPAATGTRRATHVPASACWPRPRRAAGPAASWRSWCCSRSRTSGDGDLDAALAAAGARAVAGRARGLRPGLRRRGRRR